MESRKVIFKGVETFKNPLIFICVPLLAARPPVQRPFKLRQDLNRARLPPGLDLLKTAAAAAAALSRLFVVQIRVVIYRCEQVK